MAKPGPKRRIKVDPETGCHLPDRNPHPSGYHLYRYKGRRLQAHRVVWMETFGDLADDLTLDHLCRNRQCVNVAHLEPVTITENIRRAPRCKLSLEAAELIRSSSATGRALAKLYGVSEGTISLVRSGAIWKAQQREIGG